MIRSVLMESIILVFFDEAFPPDEYGFGGNINRFLVEIDRLPKGIITGSADHKIKGVEIIHRGE